jgi:hypothetical protein
VLTDLYRCLLERTIEKPLVKALAEGKIEGCNACKMLCDRCKHFTRGFGRQIKGFGVEVDFFG